MSRMTDWKDFEFSNLASGPLFFYVGAGLSSAAGLVRWNEMASLIWWYQRHYEGKKDLTACPPDERTTRVAKKNAAFLQSFVAERESGWPWSPRILSRESRDPRGLGRTALLNMILRYRAPQMQFTEDHRKAAPIDRDRPPTRPGKEPWAEDLVLHSLIWRSACNGVLTTNYDMLLEHAYSLFHHGTALRSYRYNADFLRYILSNPRFVLKLHGDINDIGSMELDPNGAWKRSGSLGDRKGKGMDLKEVYRAILDQGHMVYVGCGFRDRTIEELHGFWLAQRRKPCNCRIALIPVWEASRELRSRFREIEFLTFSGFHEVRAFLERVEGARSKTQDWKPSPEATDIHRQVFLSEDGAPPIQHWKTNLWTCRGEKLKSRGRCTGRGRVGSP